MNTQIRLHPEEIKIIKETVLNVFGESDIYIFGSRTDLNKKGGDVDIFVIPQNYEDLYEKRIKAKILLKDLLFRNVDIVVHKNFEYEIEKEALKGIKI
ncbi:nucleotidyltransferase domain-containing protein [Caminibacter sp.]